MGAVVEIWLEYLIPFLQWDSRIVEWLNWRPVQVQMKASPNVIHAVLYHKVELSAGAKAKV